MTTKTEWLDWLEASTDRLQERYREAWTRLPRRARKSEPEDTQEAPPKPWCAIQPQIYREPRDVVVHLELPEPHTVEADVRVIGSTLAISVLRRGSHIEQARVEDCYRRAIPLPPRVDPSSAVHKVHGDELVIRMQPKSDKRRSSRSGSRKRAPANTGPEQTGGAADVQAEGNGAAAAAGKASRKGRNRSRGTTARVTELPVGEARRSRQGRTQG